MIDQKELLDKNLYETITNCTMQKKNHGNVEILVTYKNGSKERIWTFDPKHNSFEHCEFIGKTKIEAIFYCDRKKPRKI